MVALSASFSFRGNGPRSVLFAAFRIEPLAGTTGPGPGGRRGRRGGRGADHPLCRTGHRHRAAIGAGALFDALRHTFFISCAAPGGT